MERGTKRTAEQAADNTEMPTAASLEEVGDVRVEFGEDSESSMLASSHVLRVVSPVFNRMLQSGMKETQQSIIRVDVASKEEFITFYNFLGPVAWSTDQVTEANVDSLVTISDYYQVEIIKRTCEDLLLTLPVTGTRLVQADKHGLKRQFERCTRHLAKQSTKEDLEVLHQSAPYILLQVALKKQEMLNPLMAMKDGFLKCIAEIQEAPQPPDSTRRFFQSDRRWLEAFRCFGDMGKVFMELK